MRGWMLLAKIPGLLFNAWSIYWLSGRGHDACLADTNRVKARITDPMDAMPPGEKGGYGKILKIEQFLRYSVNLIGIRFCV